MSAGCGTHSGRKYHRRRGQTCTVCWPDPTALGATTNPGLVTSSDVTAATGATYRQLDWWTRAGYVAPVGASASVPGSAPLKPITGDPSTPGSGRARMWDQGEVQVIARMVRLAAAGVDVRVAARVARTPGAPVEVADGVWVTVR